MNTTVIKRYGNQKYTTRVEGYSLLQTKFFLFVPCLGTVRFVGEHLYKLCEISDINGMTLTRDIVWVRQNYKKDI